MRKHTAGRRFTAIALAIALGTLGAACSSGDDADDAAPDADAAGDGANEDGDDGAGAADVELPEGYEGYTSENYADDARWLCKPGIADDVCSRDLDATVVAADGTTEVVEHQAADDAPVDCFYVYPTTSRDEGPNRTGRQ